MSEEQTTIAEIVKALRGVEGPLLPTLHRIQEEFGYIPVDAVPDIARALNLSRADVHGVISFYHQFRQQPIGRHRVQICRAEACQAMGARALEVHAKAVLGIDFGETSSDGSVTLDAVYCLGNCACSPSVRIGDAVYARVTSDRFDQLIADLRNAEKRL